MTSNTHPKISIVMPVYNAEKYLRSAIDSILRQTYANFELIIVNDGSSDESKVIIDRYASIDNRIKVIHQENRGVVATANYAASLATGEYISRHDADDISFDTKLQDWIDCIHKHPDAIVITGSIEVINYRDEFAYKDYVPTTNDDIKRSLHLRNPLPNGATLIKKTAFDEVDGYSDVFAEDCHLWTKLYAHGKFIGTGTFVYKWRMNSTGLTFSNLQKSIHKEKEYVDAIWDIDTPEYLTRKKIIDHYQLLMKHFPADGISYKKMFLHDLARVCIHLMKRGYKRQGCLQLITIASTGRTGVKTIASRLLLTIKGNIPKKGRQSASQI